MLPFGIICRFKALVGLLSGCSLSRAGNRRQARGAASIAGIARGRHDPRIRESAEQRPGFFHSASENGRAQKRAGSKIQGSCAPPVAKVPVLPRIQRLVAPSQCGHQLRGGDTRKRGQRPETLARECEVLRFTINIPNNPYNGIPTGWSDSPAGGGAAWRRCAGPPREDEDGELVVACVCCICSPSWVVAVVVLKSSLVDARAPAAALMSVRGR